MSWLSDILGKIVKSETETLPDRKILRFLGPVVVSDNPSEQSTDVTISAGADPNKIVSGPWSAVVDETAVPVFAVPGFVVLNGATPRLFVGEDVIAFLYPNGAFAFSAIGGDVFFASPSNLVFVKANDSGLTLTGNVVFSNDGNTADLYGAGGDDQLRGTVSQTGSIFGAINASNPDFCLFSASNLLLTPAPGTLLNAQVPLSRDYSARFNTWGSLSGNICRLPDAENAFGICYVNVEIVNVLSSDVTVVVGPGILDIIATVRAGHFGVSVSFPFSLDSGADLEVIAQIPATDVAVHFKRVSVSIHCDASYLALTPP